MVTLLVTSLVGPSVSHADQTYAETTGGVANTWTNYTNAGGTAGPQIGSNQTVQIACKVTGFRVADGNTWWYRIAQSPWNNQFYVSADAFYNNGATSGSLHGTPFVDPAVPDCSSLPSGNNETTGGVANTWTDYTSAGGTAGPQIGANQTVVIACKVTGFKVADGNTWWYRIASAPWSGNYYVSADAFYNNGATSGSLVGTPFVDPAVPDCAGSAGGDTGGGKPAPSVTLAQGPAAPAGYRYAITLNNFTPGTAVSITCYDSVSPSGFYTFSLTTNASGTASTASYCYSGDGPDHWVRAGGVESNHVSWGASTGGNGSTGGGSGNGSGQSSGTVINGINVGTASNSRHLWGSCTVQDFNGGPYGHVIVDYTHGTNVVRNGMLWGWFDNGGAPGFGCAKNTERGYSNGVRQDFDSGTLYWVSGMDHAKKVTWTDINTDIWAGYVAAGTNVSYVSGSWRVPAVSCSSSSAPQHTSQWVGIDGFNVKQLLQAGSSSDCDGGRASYNLWWEKLSQGQFVQGVPEHTIGSARPGDSISVTVSYNLNQFPFSYTILVSQNGTVITRSTGTYLDAPKVTAECIVERSSYQDSTGHIAPYPLANFGTATFDSCNVGRGASPSAVPLGPGATSGFTTYRLDMQSGGTLQATPSLNSSGKAPWSVYWRHS